MGSSLSYAASFLGDPKPTRISLVSSPSSVKLGIIMEPLDFRRMESDVTMMRGGGKVQEGEREGSGEDGGEKKESLY